MKSLYFYNFPQKYGCPVQTFGIAADEDVITALYFERFLPGNQYRLHESELIHEAACQLESYLKGERKDFSFPMKAAGTDFQQRVWRALKDIPYGETVSYRDIACAVGNPKASRAVGMANHRNPLPIFIPCHRVIGADGKMVGYGGGLSLKTFLLEIEKAHGG